MIKPDINEAWRAFRVAGKGEFIDRRLRETTCDYDKNNDRGFFNWLSQADFAAYELGDFKNASAFFFAGFRLPDSIHRYSTEQIGQAIPERGNFLVVVNNFDDGPKDSAS